MSLRAWRYYSEFYRGSYKVLPLSIGSGVAQSLLLLPIAFLVRTVFDSVLTDRNYGLLILISIAILGLYLLSGGAALLTQFLTLRTTKRVTERVRQELLHNLYRLSRSYLTHADLGQMQDTIVQNSQRLDVMGSAIVAQFLPAALTTIALAGILLYLNPLLFLIMLSIAPVLLLVTKLTAKRVIDSIRAYYRSFSEFSAGVLFVLQSMDLTRVQAAEDVEAKRQRAKIEHLRVASVTTSWLQAILAQVQNMVIAVAGIVILIVGGSAVATKQMTIGELLSFYAVTALLQNYVSVLSLTVPQIIAGHESLLSLYDMLHIEAPLPYSGTERIEFSGLVNLDSVSFGYSEHDVFQEVSLRAEPATVVGIIGPNGAGKSTLINLILGFYHPRQGEIYFDGRPLECLDVVHLRRQIGVVMQDPILFPGTITENISYGYPEATEEEVVRAAEIATAHDFISRLPNGYETDVGEHGTLLSGGQRQRIAIARALLRRPALLLLDEPTNHLDDEGVRLLLRNLHEEERAPAILIISHNREVVRECDEVFHLQDGHVSTALAPIWGQLSSPGEPA